MVWLYKVAKTRCLISRRKSKFAPKVVLSLDELMPDRLELEKLSGNSEPTPEMALMRRENAKRLRNAVQKLPPEYRLILVLHNMEELSDGDIAEITGLVGHQNAITDQNQAVGAVPFYRLLAGRHAIKIEAWLP